MKKLINKAYRKLKFNINLNKQNNTKSRWKTILLLVVLITLMNVLLGKNLAHERYPWYANISVFLILNINIILVLTLSIVIFRYVIKYLSERENKIFGMRLRTKLTIFMILLTLFPTFSFFYISVKLINETINKWYDKNIYETIGKTKYLNDSFIKYEMKKLSEQTDLIGKNFNNLTITQLSKYYQDGIFDNVIVFTDTITYRATDSPMPTFLLSKDIAENLSNSTGLVGLDKSDDPYFWGVTPIKISNNLGVLIIIKKIDIDLIRYTENINDTYYLTEQLRYFSFPLKKSFSLFLFFISMLIIFASIWCSLLFVRSLVKPLRSLVYAANKISAGDLSVKVDVSGNDELTILSKAFNEMSQEIGKNSTEMKQKNIELNNALAQISIDKSYIDTIYKNVDVAIILFDRNLRMLKSNDAANKLIDESPTLQKEALYKISKKFITNGNKTAIYKTDIHYNNKIYSIKATKIVDNNDMLGNILVIIEDNTNIINLQRIELWKEVATRIAHEIKNPLTPVKLTAERVKRRSVEINDKDLQKIVATSMVTIIQEVDELTELVEDFDLYARAPVKINERVNIGKLLEELNNIYRKTATHSITIEIQDALTVLGDSKQLKRVFRNLIQNSLQAINENGEIIIRASLSGGFAVVSIYDNGSGIAQDDIQKLFTPYFSNKPSGTGLGLAIVKKIIEEHNGQVLVESELNKYTIFTVTIPSINGFEDENTNN